MKTLLPILSMALFLFASNNSWAQPELPQPSPFCSITQTVGLSQITVAYSRPGVKDRTIFGELVPYDKMWRTGANKATRISFTSDVKINGSDVAAGDYSVFTIPGKDEWTIILNKETELWGTGGYDKAEDALRFTVKPQATKEKFETLTIEFANIKSDQTTLWLAWENTEVYFNIGVDTRKEAMSNIESEISSYEGGWRVYVRSANYLAEEGIELKKALAYTEKAIEIEEHWWSYWVQAEVYAKMNDYKSAVKSLKKSIKIGSENENWGYKERLEKLLKEYEEKA